MRFRGSFRPIAASTDVDPQRVDRIRFSSSPLQNHVIDEFVAGRLNRRDFGRRAVLLGLSLPAVGTLLAACGGDDPGAPSATASTGTTAPGTSGSAGPAPATSLIKAGITTPGREIDPWVLGSYGAIGLLSQVGEYLCLNTGQGELRPMLAQSWQPNDDASIWTFTLRSGVTFNDGTPLTAKDVAATFNALADPANGTNGLETLQGVLSTGAATARDDTTVVFELDGPNGIWPWLASSDNTSAVILPANYAGGFADSWIGTGPWLIDEYVPEVRASFVRNENYWGPKSVADRLEMTMYEDSVAMTLALQAGDVDAISTFSVPDGQALLGNTSAYSINVLQSSAHNPVNLRCLDGPLADKRIRRALALTLDRQIIVDQLLSGYAQVGNDSPFAPVFPTTDTTVPQRTQDFEQAKSLLAEAGATDVTFDLAVWDVAANAEFAQLMQNWAAEVGIRINLVLQDTSTFLGSGEFGSSPQLDSVASVADWGSRGVPNVFLTAQLTSDGVRNAAHWYNDEFDNLYAEYAAEPDLQTQKKLAGQLQQLLLDETPMIYPFFVDYLTATKPTVTGVVPSAMGHLFLDQAGISA